MPHDVNIDGYEQIVLDDEALDIAINQAEEAVRAGYDPQEQLIDAIKAYLFANRVINGVPWNPTGDQ